MDPSVGKAGRTGDEVWVESFGIDQVKTIKNVSLECEGIAQGKLASTRRWGAQKQWTQFIILPRGNPTKMSKIYIEY